MEDIFLEEKKYIWINQSDQTGQDLYCYLNEKGEKVYGNIVTNSSTEFPYSEHSIHKRALCRGEAVIFVERQRKSNSIK